MLQQEKDIYGEVEEFICNECRFERKDTKDWTIEGPRHIDRHSVISTNKYGTLQNSYKRIDSETVIEIDSKHEKIDHDKYSFYNNTYRYSVCVMHRSCCLLNMGRT